LTALAPDALAGLEVGYAGETLRGLAGGLAELGARIAADDAPVDLLLVPVEDGSSFDGAASGALAAALTDAFAAARDGASRLRPGACLLFVLSPADDTARAAIESLTRTLALEWAPGLRVNALACEHPADAVDLAALAAWRASRALTGAILDARPA
jgi:hypothetical protein